MTTARRPMDLFEIWIRILKAGVEIYNLTASKHDLKPSGTFFWKFACDLGFAGCVIYPRGRLSHEALQRIQVQNTKNTKYKGQHMFQQNNWFIQVMSLIGYLNELIDDSMDFPFYQQFNPLFNWISAPLSIGRSIFCARGLGPAGLGWIFNQIINAIVGKGVYPLTIHSNDWD